MKTASLISGWIALLLVFVAPSSLGQADKPDLEVLGSDISFNPTSPVSIGTDVERMDSATTSCLHGRERAMIRAASTSTGFTRPT
jgi:hypothetical protein